MRAPLDRDVAQGQRRRSVGALACAVIAVIAALGVAACGSSGGSGHSASSNPHTLLRQTFASSHSVRSGVLGFSLVITPTGSSLITSPVTLSLGGPFQSRGAGRTPESAFTVAFSGLGKHGSFGVRTTASAAYVTLQGSSYQLPAADFAKLRSTLGSSHSSAPGLSTFGIDPESWLRDPRIVGTATIDGVATEHVHAGVDVPAFVQSLNRLLARESSTLHGATSISPARAKSIAADIRNASVDVYTDRADTTLRRLVVSATVPTSGAISTRLGGLQSAAFTLTLDYSQLNQPQTIAAPGDVHSYAELQTALRSLGAQLESGLSSGASGTTGPSSGSSGSVSKYTRCISAANGDVSKMQKCQSLLQGGG